MFDFLRSGNRAPADFGALGTDMHAHWLPGLDDGAKTMDETLTLIRGLVDRGYTKLIATPHVMADLYHNRPDTILSVLEEVRQVVAEQNIEVELDAAAEYLLDEGFAEKLKSDDLLTLPGKHILVEFSFVSPPPDRDKIFFDLLTKGYFPILAHPERYCYYHSKFDEYRTMADRGIKLQVNLLSLTGHYGKTEKKIAERLISEGLVSILGTDAHHQRHLKGLSDLLSVRKYHRARSLLSCRNREWFG